VVPEPVRASASVNLTLRRWPIWFAPAVMALVAWFGGAHQPGPLIVYPEARILPLAWYVAEQALAVGITLAALMAGAALVTGRLLPYRQALQTVCDARFLLALAAAFISHHVTRAFLPGKIIDTGGPHGLKLDLAPFQIVWLIVVTLVVASLLLRVALGYFRLLSTAVPTPARCLVALLLALILGETTAQMVSRLLFRLFLWPP
jgi:hypothetical protein